MIMYFRVNAFLKAEGEVIQRFRKYGIEGEYLNIYGSKCF